MAGLMVRVVRVVRLVRVVRVVVGLMGSVVVGLMMHGIWLT